MSILQTAALVGSLAASVAAHGHVTGIIAGGVWYEGYDPSFQYANPAPVVIGWSDTVTDNGFVAPDAYGTADIICHRGAKVAGTAAKVAAGSEVQLQWSPWPDSHHGPVIDYLAPVSGDFADVDKTALEWTKIDAVGLVDDSSEPGTWGSDKLIANNNTWAVTIPKSIAPGNYVLRHEIIALHSANNADGAQNYPQCINLEVTGSGTDKIPTGVVGEKLYTNTAAPGILVNIYQSLSTYDIPGPSLYSGAGSAPAKTTASSAASTANAVATSSTVVVTSAKASTSTPAATSVAPVTTSKAAPTTKATSAPHAPASYGNGASSSKTSVAKPETTSACTSVVTVTVTKSKSSSVASITSVAKPITSASSVYSTTEAKPTTSVSLIAPISSIASALPSSALTATIPTSAPTKTASGGAAPTSTGSGDDSWGTKPSKPLPAGWTLQDLLEWVSYLLSKLEASGAHKRDFNNRK